MFRINELTEYVLTDAVIQETKNSDVYLIDIIWYYLYQMKSSVASNYRFQLLLNIVRLVLVVFDAGIERVYELVDKNNREGTHRNRLDIEGSFHSILAVKLA